MARGPIELVDEEVDLGDGLRLIVTRPCEPSALLDAAVSDGAEDAPYWAEIWPSARALAAHSARLELSGSRAIELGCGVGLVSAAAALAGAEVLAVDHDPDAVELAVRNGAQAGVRVRGLVADLLDPRVELAPAGPYELVLVADLLYEPLLGASVAALVPRLTAPGGRALVAFPWRRQADALAGSLRTAGLLVALDELRVPGMPGARTVGLLEARRDRHEPFE